MNLKGALEVLNQGPILLCEKQSDASFKQVMRLYRVHYLGMRDGVQYIFTQASGWETAQAGSHVFGVTAYRFLGDFLVIRVTDGAEFGLDFGATPEDEADFNAEQMIELQDPKAYKERERVAIQWALELTPLANT